MFCESCGTQITEQMSFCPNCGAAVNQKAPEASAPEQPAASKQAAPVYQKAAPVYTAPPIQGQGAVREQQAIVQKQTVYTRKLPIVVIILLTLGFSIVGVCGGFGGATIALAMSTIPGIVLMILIYRLDRIEPEPVGLLVKLFLCGGTISIVLAVAVSMLLQVFLGYILEPGTFLYVLIDAFFVTALVEESSKYIVLKKITWKNPAFNYRFDGVIYSTTVAIGFEIIEDLLYLIDSTAGIAFIRAAFPGHCIFGIYMGYYFGQAKHLELAGQPAQAKSMRRKGVLTATVLHGLYDFCCLYVQSAPDWLMVILVVAVISLMVTLNVTAYKNIKKYAREDQEV